MPSYDPKHVARRFDDEVLNAGNLLAADEVLAADYVDRGMPEGWPRGVDGFRQFYKMVTGIFLDVRVTVEDMITEDDKVAVRPVSCGK